MMTDIVEIRIARNDDFSLTFAVSQGSEFIDTELICTGVCTYSSDREGEVFVTDIHGIYCLKTLVRHLLTRAREECQSEHRGLWNAASAFANIALPLPYLLFVTQIKRLYECRVHVENSNVFPGPECNEQAQNSPHLCWVRASTFLFAVM